MHAEQHCYYKYSICSNQSYIKETKPRNMYAILFHYKNGIHSKEKKVMGIQNRISFILQKL